MYTQSLLKQKYGHLPAVIATLLTMILLPYLGVV